MSNIAFQTPLLGGGEEGKWSKFLAVTHSYALKNDTYEISSKSVHWFLRYGKGSPGGRGEYLGEGREYNF